MATQAPSRSSRRTRSSGRTRATKTGTQAAAPAPEKNTPATETKATGSGREAKPKEPKVYVFGGSLETPQPGANARRLWKFLSAHLSQAQIAKVKAELKKGQPAEDRFIRWQRVVDACKAVGVEKVKIGDAERPIGQALVRSLQQEDKGGEIGRDGSITIF